MEFAHMLGWIAGLQSLVNTNNVPLPVSGEGQDRPFTSSTKIK
jgi:hypothetical protein